MVIGLFCNMLTNNSQCEFYLTVLAGVYHDLVSVISPQSEVERDIEEIHSRTLSEGFGFLTKTLPKLGKAIDRSLGQGSTLQFQGFKKYPGTQLPAFCRSLFRVLFTNEGIPKQAKLRDYSCSDAVEHPNKDAGGGNTSDPSRETMIMALKGLRQICYLCYKVEIPYHEDQVNNVISSFKEAEQDLRGFYPRKLAGPDKAVLKHASHLIRRVLANVCPYSGIPRHGPGSVSTGEKSPEKHRFRRDYTRLSQVFDHPTWMMLNADHISESFDEMRRLPVEKYGIASVKLVPKDSRGPRLISAEPLEYQWIQQALMAVLVTAIESHELTRGHVNFSNQEINRDLALEGSSTGRWVTLDMKEASDRVSLSLVHKLFDPRWFRALYASRTPKTRLPDGTLVRMKKFAPMGSAVCFPVEALVFWALSVSALMIYKHMQLREAASRVFVYGDDIVTDCEDHTVVTQCLERFALKVNQDKCCVAGFFRESCGMDAFYGSPVTPLKLRKPWLNTPKPSTLVSYIAFSNAMYERGCFSTAAIVEWWIQKKTGSSVPVVSDRNPAIVCFQRPHQVSTDPQPRGVKIRWNPDYQRREVRGLTLRPTSVMTKTYGFPLLLRLLAEMERNKDQERDVLKSSPKPDETGMFAIAHREKPTRAWTPLR